MSAVELWLAALDRCASDLSSVDIFAGSGEAPRIRRAADRWLQSGRRDPGSFLWVCAALDIDPEATREGLYKRAVMLRATRGRRPASGEGR